LPRGFGWYMGCLIRSCCDDHTDSLPEGVSEFWVDQFEALEDDAPQKGEIRRLVQMSTNITGTWGLSEIRETAFKRIELVSKIDVSA